MIVKSEYFAGSLEILLSSLDILYTDYCQQVESVNEIVAD
jgi:hypothetical protein